MNVVVRSSLDRAVLVDGIRRELRALDKDLAMARIRPLQEYVSDAMARTRFVFSLTGIFAFVAVALTLVGLFGVVSYSVSQRAHEFGVRLALGAARRDIVGLVLGQGVLMALGGVALGLGGAVLLTRFLGSLLYGVKAVDLGTFTLYSSLLVGVAAIACYLPARRAAAFDPIRALRVD
jgi:putative ABC transport system permease protein